MFNCKKIYKNGYSWNINNCKCESKKLGRLKNVILKLMKLKIFLKHFLKIKH